MKGKRVANRRDPTMWLVLLTLIVSIITTAYVVVELFSTIAETAEWAELEAVEHEVDHMASEIPVLLAVQESTPAPFFPITEEERHYIECIVAGESRGEPLEGQKLVAQCILNAMSDYDYSPKEVKEKMKYSGWYEHPEEFSSVREAVSAIFDRGELGVEDHILWFYAPKNAKGIFHNTQRFVTECGGHRFYAPWE